MKFWDASAIIPLCLEEPWTPWLSEVLAEDTLMIVWWGSLVECWSAFARLRREGLFQTRDEEHARFWRASPLPGRRSSPVKLSGTTPRTPSRGTPCVQRMGCDWPRRSCGSRGSRAVSPLSAWIIACGLPPSVKVFSSFRLRNPCKRPRHPSVSNARVPSPRP